jgi:hypothetical protein
VVPRRRVGEMAQAIQHPPKQAISPEFKFQYHKKKKKKEIPRREETRITKTRYFPIKAIFG